MLDTRMLTPVEIVRKCHYQSDQCRYLAHGPDGFSCLAVIPLMRREVDRRVAAGLTQATSGACADPMDAESETHQQGQKPTVDGPLGGHDANLQYDGQSAWKCYCTCGWIESVSMGLNVDLLTRKRKEMIARSKTYEHLIAVGATVEAQEYADYYRIKDHTPR